MTCGYAIHFTSALVLYFGAVPMSAFGVSDLAVKVVTLTESVALGGKGELTIQTEAGALCVGKAWNEEKPTQRVGLSAQSVDSNGHAAWTWHVPKAGPPGRWSIDLQCATTTKKERLSLVFRTR